MVQINGSPNLIIWIKFEGAATARAHVVPSMLKRVNVSAKFVPHADVHF